MSFNRDDFFSAEEVEERLKIHYRTVLRWCKIGKLPSIPDPQHSYRYLIPKSAVEERLNNPYAVKEDKEGEEIFNELMGLVVKEKEIRNPHYLSLLEKAKNSELQYHDKENLEEYKTEMKLLNRILSKFEAYYDREIKFKN